jgi:multimeric flavodoxin WrbA
MTTKTAVKTESAYLPGKKVFGVSGSPRKGGNSDVILNHISKGVRQHGIPAEKARLFNYDYQPCIGCEKCRKNNVCKGLNDGMHLLYPNVIESQGIVLVCPTHNYNITAWMKAFIDRLYCLYIFDNNRPRGWSSCLNGQNRKAVIAAVCEQIDKNDMGFTLEAMRRPIEALGYEVVGELAVFGIFERGAVRHEDETLAQARELGNQLAKRL